MTWQKRQAVRAILLTSEGQILLMQAQEPNSTFRVWFAPGGGMEPGEEPETCLRREIFEETGLLDAVIGPAVWKRRHDYEWDGRFISQEEVFHVVAVERFEPDMAGNPSEAERGIFRKFRWWSAAEIAVSDDTFAPSALSHHLSNLIAEGPPREVIDVGV